jgi:hypothetical protein
MRGGARTGRRRLTERGRGIEERRRRKDWDEGGGDGEDE